MDIAKRIFDLTLSSFGLIILLPFILLIAIAVKLESKGEVIFKQSRVGLNNTDFILYKFRTMQINTEKQGQLTIGKNDSRITKVGYILRKYKLDELPQLFNVLVGNMSLVGPRPEVRKFVNLYTSNQLQILEVKPGITDFASIQFFDESEILGQSQNPELTYINEIMPKKLQLNIDYIHQKSIFIDIKIIMSTLIRILR